MIQLWSAKEAKPKLRGDLEIVDVETGERRDVTVTERALSAYARAHAQYCDELAAFCAGRAIPYCRADVDTPFDELVLRIFRAGGFLA